MIQLNLDTFYYTESNDKAIDSKISTKKNAVTKKSIFTVDLLKKCCKNILIILIVSVMLIITFFVCEALFNDDKNYHRTYPSGTYTYPAEE